MYEKNTVGGTIDSIGSHFSRIVVFLHYSICDINSAVDELANDPSASGIDYGGIGWGYGIGLFTISVLDLILSCVSKKLQQRKIYQYISFAAALVFVLLMAVSVILFFR